MPLCRKAVCGQYLQSCLQGFIWLDRAIRSEARQSAGAVNSPEVLLTQGGAGVRRVKYCCSLALPWGRCDLGSENGPSVGSLPFLAHFLTTCIQIHVSGSDPEKIKTKTWREETRGFQTAG